MNREDILAANHLKTETIDVPEFGGKVTIRELTASKARELNSTLKSINDDGMLPILWLIASVINDDGSPAFTKDDLERFENTSQAAIRRISNAAIRLNGMDRDPDEIQKNS